MQKPISRFSLVVLVAALFCHLPLYAQREVMQKDTCGAPTVHSKNALTATPLNYRWFTQSVKDTTTEAVVANAAFVQHPEVNRLYAETPCDNCYELMGKRTEKSKTFIKEGTQGKEIMQQTSTLPMHYRDADGSWMTIQSQLRPTTQQGVYAVDRQEIALSINTADQFTSLGTAGAKFQFNNGLELMYATTDGTEVSLGKADWSHYTAGDDGVYVTEAWPGVDIEMSVSRNAVKTNFYINHAMPEYANGTLLVRDHLQMDKGLSMTMYDGSHFGATAKYTGTIDIADKDGYLLYAVSAAAMYEKNNYKPTLSTLEYQISDKGLDIALPGNVLNRPALSYPVIIDPLVSLATSLTVAGSSYSSDWTVGCAYLNAATVPANVTVTDIQFSFTYKATGGAALDEGASDFNLGTCRSPTGSTGLAGFYWYCGSPFAGTCASTGGSAYSIYSDIATCVPAPQCASYDMDITMNLYQDHHTTAACASTYVYGTAPLIITVFGHTVETSTITVTGGTTICAGESTSLSATPSNGVAPYTIEFDPGAVMGSPASVSPTATTVYTVTVTDACGVTATATKTITVNPISPITGATNICVGGTSTFTDAGATGTWSSLTPTVASINATTGIATGIAAGTTVIKFTTAAGCTATVTCTVSTPPTGIVGSTSFCVGATSALTDAVGGGVWSSDNTSIATVGAATGLAGGIAAGTASITYSTGAECQAVTTVTVNATPVITGSSFTNPTVCGASDGTITLAGLTASASYVVHYTGAAAESATIVADAAGNVVITGLTAGSYTNISVTSLAGCVSATMAGPVTLINVGAPAIPEASSNSPVCSGGLLLLSATDATAGVTYSWTGPGGFSSVSQNPSISAAPATAAGTYSVTATLAGCASLAGTAVVVIHTTPVITGITATNPTTCLGADGTVMLTGLSPATTYTVNYDANGTAQTATVIANALGDGVLLGLASTIYDNFSVTTLTCVSNTIGPVTLNDPGAPTVPTIGSNSPVCVGNALLLYGEESQTGTTYSWTGPNGFTSTEQNPEIAATTTASGGNYILTVTKANCSSSANDVITLYAPVVLTDVTPDQIINYGSTVHLMANSTNALYYRWTPADGSLSNANINDPIAAPLAPTAYTVYGMSEYGCIDSATINIGINYDSSEFIPSAFTPNNDGLNDVFRIGNVKYVKLVEFSVYNRWGQRVYHNEYNIEQGWDGTFNGTPQDMGVYNYSVTLITSEGVTKNMKGDVTLIR